MDLMGPFEVTTRGNQYTLTVMCMLTNYVICVPLTNKSTATILKADLREVYCRIVGSRKILSDNGSEFKSSLFLEVATPLRIKYSFSSQYRPQASGWIEASHKFINNCSKNLQ